MAGFEHLALVEIDKHSVRTLQNNRPSWNVVESDLNAWDPAPYKNADLLSAGLPCPPFSKAGKQLGIDDERNLFPRALEIIRVIRPKAVMIENVRGLLDAVFHGTRLTDYWHTSN
jgi:DNA (cytosine-5)-methyltransferase 1